MWCFGSVFYFYHRISKYSVACTHENVENKSNTFIEFEIVCGTASNSSLIPMQFSNWNFSSSRWRGENGRLKKLRNFMRRNHVKCVLLLKMNLRSTFLASLFLFAFAPWNCLFVRRLNWRTYLSLECISHSFIVALEIYIEIWRQYISVGTRTSHGSSNISHQKRKAFQYKFILLNKCRGQLRSMLKFHFPIIESFSSVLRLKSAVSSQSVNLAPTEMTYSKKPA